MSQETKPGKVSSLFSAILQIAGIIIFLIGIIVLLNTLFNWNYGLRISGAEVELPDDYASAIAFFIIGVIMAGTGWFIGLSNVRMFFKKNKWLVFVIPVLLCVAGFFGLNQLNIMSMGGPALAAAQQNKPEVLQKLYAENKVDVKDTELLSRALFYESKDVILYLINKGVDTNREFKEGIPMIFWALRIDAEITMAFLDAGTDVTVKNSEGETILIALAGSYALSEDDAIKIAQVMLDNNADKDARNKEEKTAAEIAKDRGYEELAEVLK